MDSTKTDALKIVLKGAGLITIGTFFSRITAYIYRIILARWLGPFDYGIISLGLVAVGMLTALSIFGLDRGVERFVAFHEAKHRTDQSRRVILTSLFFVFSVSIALTALLLFSTDAVAVNIFSEPRLAPILVIFAFVVPLAAVSGVLVRTFRAFKKPEYAIISRSFAENIMKLGSAIILLYLGLGIIGAAVSYLLSFVTSTLLLLYFLDRKLLPFFKARKELLPDVKELLLFSLPLSVMGFMNQVFVWTDTIFLGYFLGSAYVGVYNAALPTAQALLLFQTAFMGLTIPVFMSFYTKGDNNQMIKLSKTLTRWVFIFTFPMLLIIVLFAGDILQILFGPTFEGGALPLIILSAGMFVLASTGPIGHILNVRKKTSYHMYNTAIAAIVNIILNYFLIQKWGMAGAAIATASSTALWSLFLIIEVRFLEGGWPYSFSLVKPMVYSTLAAILSYLVVKQLVPFSRVLYITIFLLLFVGVYGVLLGKAGGLTKEDNEVIFLIKEKANNTFSKLPPHL